MLVLTQGTHVIDDPTAVEVERALEAGAKAVDVVIDMTGGGNTLSRARISMAHVIAVIRHQEMSNELHDFPAGGNVYALSRRG